MELDTKRAYNPVEFVESAKKKLMSLAINSFLVFGVLWIPLPGVSNLPPELQKMDLYLTFAFGIPLLYQLIAIGRRTHLIIDDTGIHENITSHKDRSYLWSNIKAFRFIKVLNSKYLLITLKNEEEYIQSLTKLEQILSKFDKKRYGSAVKIPLSKIPHGIDNVFLGLRYHAERFSKGNNT